MNLPTTITDNITEILIKIIEFTYARQQILNKNINNIDTDGFIPRDLAVDEFSGLLSSAIDEHVRNKRLVLYDTKNIKFGPAGAFQARALIDEPAKKILEKSRDEYLELQINKLLENSLNQRVAAELLKQKQQAQNDI